MLRRLVPVPIKLVLILVGNDAHIASMEFLECFSHSPSSTATRPKRLKQRKCPGAHNERPGRFCFLMILFASLLRILHSTCEKRWNSAKILFAWYLLGWGTLDGIELEITTWQRGRGKDKHHAGRLR